MAKLNYARTTAYYKAARANGRAASANYNAGYQDGMHNGFRQEYDAGHKDGTTGKPNRFFRRNAED
jgi:hypothetical protein